MINKIDRAYISFRIGVPQWMPENRFRELLQMFEKFKGVTDEIAFFTSITHAPLPLDTIRSRADLLMKRMPAARKLGYRAGINILATIGHHNENLPNSLAGDFTYMTDVDGNISLGTLCPNDERARDYVRELYKIVASARPDFIWIDDDIRLSHWPLKSCGCFCDNCLRLMSREAGKEYTRGAIKRMYEDLHAPGRMEFLKDWAAHNRKMWCRLLALIAETVHGIDSAMPVGKMTGETYSDGADFAEWAQILAGPQKADVMWRPGGGASDEEKDVIRKSHRDGRQVSVLPETVVSIQSETENFPYQILKKALHATVLEAAAHIAAGCTGAAFNILSINDEPLDEYEPLMQKLQKSRPFYDRLVSLFGRTPPQGIYTGWKTNSGFYGADSGEFASELFDIGLPAAYRLADSCITLLAGNAPKVLSDAEIKRVFSSGVYLDDEALKCLDDAGYGKLTGFKVERTIELDNLEQFTADPLNGEFAGRVRDARQSCFWPRPAAVLVPTSDKTRILARLIDYADRETASCAMGLFENELGGRVCVGGYYPWMFLKNLSKSTQMKAVMRWLSRDTLPAYVSSFHKISQWTRRLDGNQVAVALINTTIDEVRDVELMICSGQAKATMLDMECKETTLRAGGNDPAYARFTIPVIQPWHMRLVICSGQQRKKLK